MKNYQRIGMLDLDSAQNTQTPESNVRFTIRIESGWMDELNERGARALNGRAMG